ncbi:hypothetical protein SDC9_99861 [bioreactor metagenome]|uniref:Uncharacterized protein n=1 Tax=bioreactor metagenome TaxID=1076179 RepID=A0A645AJA0_9ZZZZ
MVIPLPCVLIMMLFEPETAEAILAGLVIGWIISAVMGIISLVKNRQYQIKIVKVLSIISICPICLFAILVIMQHLYR